MAHCSPTQARRGAHDALGFEISEAIHLPAAGRCQQLPATFRICVFVFGVDLQLLSVPHSPHAVKRLGEERPEVFMERRNKSCFNSIHLFVGSRLNIFPVHILTLFFFFEKVYLYYRELWLSGALSAVDVYFKPEEALAGSEGLCAACVMLKDLRALQDVKEHQRAPNSKKVLYKLPALQKIW